jgi:hypothetical protein
VRCALYVCLFQALLELQEEEKERERMAAAKAKVDEALEMFGEDAREAGANVKEIQATLRAAERESRDASKAGGAARRKLERAGAYHVLACCLHTQWRSWRDARRGARELRRG